MGGLCKKKNPDLRWWGLTPTESTPQQPDPVLVPLFPKFG